jgi:hypothetical protein
VACGRRLQAALDFVVGSCGRHLISPLAITGGAQFHPLASQVRLEDRRREVGRVLWVGEEPLL